MKRMPLVFLMLFFSVSCIAQNDPSFRQFYFNPFHFNPAYTGIDGHTDIYLATRKQWIDFKDAPLVSQFSVQYPTRGRVALGFTVFDQEVVALQNTFISAAFAYRVPIAVNKTLFFGLNGGVGVSNLDLENYDYSNDPAVMNAATTSVYGNAGFGVLYEWNQLRVGFALPQLFGQEYISPRKLGSRNFAQLLKQNYSASYKFFVGSFSFDPWILFRLSNDYQNIWDVGTTISYQEVVWLGSSFSAQQGTGFFFGMNIKDFVKIGYSYELPPADKGFIQTKSMELQLRLRLSPKREYKPGVKPIVKPERVQKNEPLTEGQKNVQKKPPESNPVVLENKFLNKDSLKTSVKKDTLVKVKPKPIIGEKIAPSSSTDGVPHIKKGYYLVTGSYKNPEYARNYQLTLRSMGFSKSDVSFNESDGTFLVYIFYSESKEEAKKVHDNFKNDLRNCYLLEVQ